MLSLMRIPIALREFWFSPLLASNLGLLHNFPRFGRSIGFPSLVSLLPMPPCMFISSPFLHSCCARSMPPEAGVYFLS